MSKSDLEASFDYYWRAIEGPELWSEHRFCERLWRFDKCHLASMVAIELDGGTWIGGRHTTGQGYNNDCEKLNRATAAGWRVFRLTSDMLTNKPHEHLTMIKDFIERQINDRQN